MVPAKALTDTKDITQNIKDTAVMIPAASPELILTVISKNPGKRKNQNKKKHCFGNAFLLTLFSFSGNIKITKNERLICPDDKKRFCLYNSL